MITTKENQSQQQMEPDVEASEVEAALRAGEELVRKHFRDISDLRVERVVDPESGEMFSEITFDVGLRGSELMAAYDALTGEWVNAYPEPVRRFIRFSFAVI